MRSALRILVSGLVAGAAGAAVQNLFFRATGKIAPSNPPDAFKPPELAQHSETATQTVARRFTEGLMLRRPLTTRQKAKAARFVHYAFGAAWGAAYGLGRESVRGFGSPLGIAGFSTMVWGASDNLILPIFGLAAWPHHYPPKTHAYALAAHWAYGGAVAGIYELLRSRRLPETAIAAFVHQRVHAHAPRAVRPFAHRVARLAVAMRVRRPIKRVRAAYAELRGAELI